MFDDSHDSRGWRVRSCASSPRKIDSRARDEGEGGSLRRCRKLEATLHGSRILEDFVDRHRSAVENFGLCPINMLAPQRHEANVQGVMADGQCTFEN